jgi:hypothetical protein
MDRLSAAEKHTTPIQHGDTMALTRAFKDSVAGRVQRDPRFREALLTEAINAYLTGETAAGKAMLRDLVNATPRTSSAL